MANTMSNHPGEDAASDTSAKPSCTICDAGYHRYGTTDPEHEHSYTACINQLRGKLDDAMRTGGEVNERSAALADALGELIDALSDEVRYECGQSSHVLEHIDRACALLGPEYHGYIGKWND